MSSTLKLLDDLGAGPDVLHRGAAKWPADLLAYVLESLERLDGCYALQEPRGWFPTYCFASSIEKLAAATGCDKRILPGWIVLPDFPKRGASGWDVNEVREFLVAHGLREPYRVSKADWWKAFVLVSRDTGLTRPKICAIHRGQIAPNGVAVIRDGKTQRIIKLRRDTQAAMLPRSQPFEFPLCSTKFWREWKAFCRLAGLPGKLRVCPLKSDAAANVEWNKPKLKPSDEPPNTLSEFFDRLYHPLRLRGKSDRTVVLYRYSIRKFSEWLQRPATLADFDDLIVSNYLSRLSKLHEPHTVEKERCQLLAMWRYANKCHFVTMPPNVPAGTLPRRDPICWDVEQLERLFETVKQVQGDYCGIPASDWWTALLMVLWDTAERIDAPLNIEWDRFDLVGRWVTIPAELRKGKTADKTHRLHPDTIDALKAISRPVRDKVFPWPFSRSSLWRVYGLILSAAHLPSDRKRKFHCIRRSVASHFEAAGGNATTLLGHSSRAVTERSYLDPRIVPRQQAADVLFRPYAKEQQS